MRLDGKTAIVTGGGSGFGAGIARKFIAEGAQVVIADINSAAAESLSDELGAAAFAAHVDVADLGSVQALAHQAEKDESQTGAYTSDCASTSYDLRFARRTIQMDVF